MLKSLIFAALCFSMWGVAGQGPDSTVNSQSQSQDRLCVVEGAVVSAATSGPIEKAAVRIYSLERNWDQATLSDSAGRFVFRDVPPGRYQLQADARGYITKAFGEQYFGGGGAEMRLALGAHPRDVLFRLTPAAVITGTVRDADSTPVMDASVAAVHPGYFQNRRQFFPTGQSKTDDRGQYRIYPLLPGR